MDSTVHWHHKNTEDVLAATNSNSSSGLSHEEARQRLKLHGHNRLPEAAPRSALLRFLLQFHNVLIYVLLVSAATTAVLGHLMDTLVILAVVIANALIGFIQEGKAEKAMEAIHQMLAPTASVLRDGKRHTIPGEELVPGDIVLLEAGDKVAADLRLLLSQNLQIQEAILTGESVPVEKQVGGVAEDAALGDRSCMAFSGTLVSCGQGKGVVIATGTNTEIGRISNLLANVETLTTPLIRQMDSFAHRLTFIILCAAAALLTAGYFQANYPFSELFMVIVGLTVAAIPEGLPAVLTITLAVGVQAMARRNAIVRRLPTIETLGSVSVICTDKTGTLTRNEMTASTVCISTNLFRISGAGYQPSGTISADKPASTDDEAALAELIHAAMLCNDAELHEQNQHWNVEGDPMEGALLTLASKAGNKLHADRQQWARTDTIPFDARHRFMATLHHDHQHHACIFVKGAPERILTMCRDQRSNGGTATLASHDWQASVERMAAEGQRVLAFATRPVKPEHTVLEHSDVEGRLTLLGLVGLIDPPRPEAITAVAECQQAGIDIKMITGDHAGTAAAIGRQIGLHHSGHVLTGADIDALDDDGLIQAVNNTAIFARTSPEHKLRLVMALQANGMTVAMTGDGVNDAPALKRADAGIAMGQKGSAAAREAADLVLADDNFASIVAAVREGRTVYSNIKKVISWTLPTNAGEAILIIMALLLGMSLPVTPIQILWVNLITAITLGLALAFEPTGKNTMRQPPRSRQEPLLTRSLAWHIVLVAMLFLGGVFGIYYYAIAQGYTPELARTMAMNTLVTLEIFHLLFIRNMNTTTLAWDSIRGTPVVWLTVSMVAIAQLAITYLPVLQTVMGTAAISLADNLLIIGTGVLLFIIIETEKQLRLRIIDKRGF